MKEILLCNHDITRCWYPNKVVMYNSVIQEVMDDKLFNIDEKIQNEIYWYLKTQKVLAENDDSWGNGQKSAFVQEIDMKINKILALNTLQANCRGLVVARDNFFKEFLKVIRNFFKKK